MAQAMNIQVYVNGMARDEWSASAHLLEGGGTVLVEGEKERLTTSIGEKYGTVQGIHVRRNRIDICVSNPDYRDVPIYVGDYLVPGIQASIMNHGPYLSYILRGDFSEVHNYIRYIEVHMRSIGSLQDNETVGYPVVSQYGVCYRAYTPLIIPETTIPEFID